MYAWCSSISDSSWFHLFALLDFMSILQHNETCSCCPKRVVISGTYKVIGSTTIDKFEAHARDEVTENVTRACHKCYDKYTRNPKQKVCTRRANIHVSNHTAYMSIHIINVWLLGPLFAIWLFSFCIHHVQKLNQLQTLADVALQSHTHQDLEHKHDDKDKVS